MGSNRVQSYTLPAGDVKHAARPCHDAKPRGVSPQGPVQSVSKSALSDFVEQPGFGQQ